MGKGGSFSNTFLMTFCFSFLVLYSKRKKRGGTESFIYLSGLLITIKGLILPFNHQMGTTQQQFYC